MPLEDTLFAATIALGLLSCCGDAHSPGEVLPLVGMAEEVELLSAQADAVIEGTRVTLRADAARNAMPGSSPSGLMASATLVSAPKPVPEGLVLEHLWVVRGDQVWSTPFAVPDQPSPSGYARRVARGGPMWGPEQPVDLVVRVRTSAGPPVYLAVRNQEVEVLQ